jgi:hypothetical protein
VINRFQNIQKLFLAPSTSSCENRKSLAIIVKPAIDVNFALDWSRSSMDRMTDSGSVG